MKIHWNRWWYATVILALSCPAMVHAQGTVQGPANVNPSKTVQTMAKKPTPPASAQQKSSIGAGNTAVSTADSKGDTDSYWVQEIDIDGDGDMEETDILWDAEDQILFFYADDSFTCSAGGTVEGSMLLAVYCDGNADKQPTGSGWYVVDLDGSECAAMAAATFGCEFDANGNETACGFVEIDADGDDIDIVEVDDEDD